MAKKLLSAIFVQAVGTAFGRGIVSAFDLDKWVACMIHVAQSSAYFTAITWILSGIIGLLGLVCWVRFRVDERLLGTSKRNSGKETAEWLALFREREILQQQVFQLKASQPKFSIIKPAIQAIMDGDDIREEQIKRNEKRIIELSDMMAQLKPKP